MRIGQVRASLHRVQVEVPLLSQPRVVPVVVVRAESEDGAVGHGVAGPQFHGSVIELINRELAPFVAGRDVLLTEGVAHELEQRFNARAMSGVVSCALSGIDIALWDLRGKVLGQPVWRLLGGYSARVPAYLTFGLPEYDLDQLVEAARLAVSRGYSRLKMVVGRSGAGLLEDVRRVQGVRQAIGPNVRLMIDANEGLELVDAAALARAVSDLDIAWFEEPVVGNDVALLAELRRRTAVPIAAGQFEGHRYRLRDLAVGSAVDVLQTNVLYVGGYTEGLKVAHIADGFRLPVANGGGWAEHNAHLMAAVANSEGVEMHAWQWGLASALYASAPVVAEGEMHLTDAPGLGLEPREEVLRDTEVRT
ncbi:MAG: mandelate racemase/muconate lactonizing enzyme family protein [Chloroflexi bacterium]|nr:mandelate racemase/muconate lactonizing enzyme family protein [Chloroflexota bacterium]